LAAKSRKFWIALGYITMGVWTVYACIHIGMEVAEQHTIFAELRAVRTGGDEAAQAAKNLIARKYQGILYAIQEMQQDADKDDNYVLAVALQKAGGRWHEHLTEHEKASVRGLIEKARYKIIDYCDGRKVTFGEVEREMLGLAVRILEKMDAANRADFMENCSLSETWKAERGARYRQECRRYTGFISLFRKILDGEPASQEEATLARMEFEKAFYRLDLCIAGEAFDLYPEERTLFHKAAVYIVKSGVQEALKKAVDKTELPAASQEFLQAVEEDGTWLYLEDARENRFRAFARLFNSEELQTLRYAAIGLDKMAGKYVARLTPSERGQIERLLEDEQQASALPADLLREYVEKSAEGGPIRLSRRLTTAERQALLRLSDEYMGTYEAAVTRFAELVSESVRRLRQANERFITYPLAEKTEGEARGGVFAVIRALWRKADDKVVMIDLVSICGSRNKRVRRLMEEALLAIGRPAVDTLIRSVRQEKIDQALAVRTEYRTRAERLRELNEQNKTVRLSCIRVLGGILRQEISPELRKRIRSALLPYTDDDDPDISSAVRLALRGK